MNHAETHGQNTRKDLPQDVVSDLQADVVAFPRWSDSHR